MTDIKRYYIPDSTVFITCVTKVRVSLLCSNTVLEIFWATFEEVRVIHRFDLFAYAILPDHFHWIIRPQDEDGNYSKIIHSFKRNFTLNYKKAMGIEEQVSLWQPRFWDHIIRNEEDLRKSVSYVHWNAVKHGFVESPEDWEQSSYYHWHEI